MITELFTNFLSGMDYFHGMHFGTKIVAATFATFHHHYVLMRRLIPESLATTEFFDGDFVYKYTYL